MIDLVHKFVKKYDGHMELIGNVKVGWNWANNIPCIEIKYYFKWKPLDHREIYNQSIDEKELFSHAKKKNATRQDHGHS